MTTIQTPVQPPRNPRPARKHSLKFWLLIGLASFAALITLSGIVSALSPAKVAPKASTSTSAPATQKATASAVAPAATAPVTTAPVTTAPVTTAPAATAPAIPAAQAAMDNWCAGSGYSDFQTVQADISQMQTATGNNDALAIEQDAATLFSDAHTAGMNLPPKSNPHSFGYGMYVAYWMVGASRASTGDFTGASSALQKALPFKADAVAIDTACGGAGF